MNINWIGLYTALKREVKRTFRVVTQTLVAPVVSAALYIFIFGTVIGSRIEEIAGVPYITFVFPGILMLSVVNAAFGSSSFSLFFMRWSRAIEEILIAPFSYIEMIIGFVSGAIFRSMLVAVLILIVGMFFGAVTLVSPVMFFFYVLTIAIIFALLGLIVGLWAESPEQLQMLNTFVITPLTYLGGIFYSITMLPEAAAKITQLNPFFYFADGIRSSMTGVHEASASVGAILTFSIAVVLLVTVVTLFKKGWKIRY